MEDIMAPAGVEASSKGLSLTWAALIAVACSIGTGGIGFFSSTYARGMNEQALNDKLKTMDAKDDELSAYVAKLDGRTESIEKHLTSLEISLTKLDAATTALKEYLAAKQK